jgi:hypothetical protein
MIRGTCHVVTHGKSANSRLIRPSTRNDYLQSSPPRYQILLFRVILLLGVLFFGLVSFSLPREVLFGIEPEQQSDPDSLSNIYSYIHLGVTEDHNDEVTARLDRCASLGLLRDTADVLPPLSPNDEARYAATGCGTKETTLIILASFWFSDAYEGTSTTGESVWAQSVISALNYHGYAYMFSTLGLYNPNMSRTSAIQRRYRRNTRLVLADPEQIEGCWYGEEQECLRTEDDLNGIEAWRLLSFWYWDK